MGIKKAVILFLVLKCLQLINSFVVLRILSVNSGSKVLLMMTGFIVILTLLGVISKNKQTESQRNKNWVYIVVILGILMLVRPEWSMVFLASIFFYGLIGAEGQVIRSLHNTIKMPITIPIVLSAIPLIASYFIPTINSHLGYIFYITTTIIAFIISAFTEEKGAKAVVYQEAPPIIVGTLFMAISIALLYFSQVGSRPIKLEGSFEVAFLLAFYAVGAMVIYLNIDSRLKTKGKVADLGQYIDTNA